MRSIFTYTLASLCLLNIYSSSGMDKQKQLQHITATQKNKAHKRENCVDSAQHSPARTIKKNSYSSNYINVNSI